MPCSIPRPCPEEGSASQEGTGWERYKEMGGKSTVKNKTSRPGGDERGYMVHTQHTHQQRSHSCPRVNMDQETPPSPCESHCEYTHDHNFMKDCLSRLWNWLSVQAGHLEYLTPLLILLSPITYCLCRIQDQGNGNKHDMSTERSLRDSSEASPLNDMKPDGVQWS